MNIGIIGGGNMGTAILSRVAQGNKIFVCEKDIKRAQLLRRKYHVAIVDIPAMVSAAEVIIVAVKPQDIDSVLAEIKPVLHKSKLVISIAAGITTSFLENRLGKGAKVIRTMPNMPAQIGEGITAIAKGRLATAGDVRVAAKIFNAVGKTVVVKETLIDAITAVSGSGPAYVFLFAECLSAAAQKLGLEKDLAWDLVQVTLQGSVHQMVQLKEDPARLRAKVTSKGGTTQAAIEIFEKQHIREIFVQALRAAKKKAGELAK